MSKNISKIKIENVPYNIKDPNALTSADKGIANGIASLDSNGKIPTSQLPSNVLVGIDTNLSLTSEKAVQNKVITTQINSILDKIGYPV